MSKSGVESFLNWSLPVGKLFGIPIKLHISLLFFVWPAYRMAPSMGTLYAVEIVVGIILSVLLHELGHALAAKAYKLQGLSIMLHGFGGFAVSQGYRTPTQALVITLCGPLVNAVLFGLSLIVMIVGFVVFEKGSEAYQQVSIIGYLGIFNLIMGIANMVPMLPFDGGQTIAAILSRRLSPLSAQRRVAHLGLVVGPICAIIGYAAGETFFAIFGVIGALTSWGILSQTGGVRFFEFVDDRKRRKEVEDAKRREREKHDRIVADAQDRERQRDEKEQLRKLFESTKDS